MKSISEFFGRIRGKHAEEIYTRTIVKDAVGKASGADVPLEAISFKPRAIVLSGLSQSAKSAVFIKKTSILRELEARSIGRPISDIRFEG